MRKVESVINIGVGGPWSVDGGGHRPLRGGGGARSREMQCSILHILSRYGSILTRAAAGLLSA